MHRGFAKIWRNIIEAPFYDNQKACRVAMHLLLKVNHKKAELLTAGEVITIQPGQTLTSIEALRKEIGLSTMSIRVALYHLERCHFITSETTSQYTILTICKHGVYNNGGIENNKQNNKPATNQQQTNNKPVTTNNKDKNVKNEKNVKKREKERNKERKPFSLHSFKNSKNKTEKNFYILFSNYPKQTFGQEAFEIFKATIKTQEDMDALQQTLEHYSHTPEYEDGVVFNLKNFMLQWRGIYDGLIQEQEQAEENRKKYEADELAAKEENKRKEDHERAELKKRDDEHPDKGKSFDQVLKEKDPALHKRVRAARAGRKKKEREKTASIKRKAEPKKKGG